MNPLISVNSPHRPNEPLPAGKFLCKCYKYPDGQIVSKVTLLRHYTEQKALEHVAGRTVERLEDLIGLGDTFGFLGENWRDSQDSRPQAASPLPSPAGSQSTGVKHPDPPGQDDNVHDIRGMGDDYGMQSVQF